MGDLVMASIVDSVVGFLRGLPPQHAVEALAIICMAFWSQKLQLKAAEEKTDEKPPIWMVITNIQMESAPDMDDRNPTSKYGLFLESPLNL